MAWWQLQLKVNRQEFMNSNSLSDTTGEVIYCVKRWLAYLELSKSRNIVNRINLHLIDCGYPMDDTSISSHKILIGIRFRFTPWNVALLARIHRLAQDCD